MFRWLPKTSRRETSTSAILITPKPTIVYKVAVDHKKLWKILQEIRIPDHLTWFLRNLYVGQETDMEQQTGSKLGKENVKAVLSPGFFSLYAKYIRQNAGLDEARAAIKIAGRDINKLRYADDTTLMAESEEQLLDEKKEESEKAGLKLNRQNSKVMASGPITSWQIDREKWKQWQTLFSWAPKSLRIVIAAMKFKDDCSSEEKPWQT